MKSTHISGLSPGVMTCIKNNLVIARNVYSDGPKLRPGQVGPQVKAQTKEVPSQPYVELGQS